MSFIGDKKRQHESDAERALADKDYAKAFFHTAKAAELGLTLAEQTDGKIARRFAADALELIDIATELKKRANNQNADETKKAMAAAGVPGNGESAGAADNPWQIKDRPEARFDDVAGLVDVKQELRWKVIEPFLHPEVYDRFKVKVGGGILMYGPPGNGKTFIARAVAGELDAAFFNVNASQIKDKYVGETEKNLERLFAAARDNDKSVIFLDEVDHLLGRRGNRKVGTVAQFLAMTDGLVQNTNCLLVLAATNKPWMIDEAVLRPGRLGTHIYVGPPDAEAREGILELNLRDVPHEEGLDTKALAERAKGFSGADMAEWVDRSKRAALTRQLETGSPEHVTSADFDTAFAHIQPSVTQQQLAQYAQWAGTATLGEAKNQKQHPQSK